MIEVRCPDCRYQLKLSDALAGRTVPCPDCKAKVSVPRINDGFEVVDDAPPRRSVPRPRTAGDAGFEVVNPDEVRTRHSDEPRRTTSQRRPPAVVAVDEPDDDGDDRVRRPARQLKKRRRPSTPFDGNVYKYVVFGGIGAGLLFALLAFVKPVLGLIGIFIGLLLTLVGGIWGLTVAFQEDVVCGLMYLLVPFYALYYLITRWEECRRPFGMNLAGWGVMLIAFLCVGVFAEDNRRLRIVPGNPPPRQPGWQRRRFGELRLPDQGYVLLAKAVQSNSKSGRP